MKVHQVIDHSALEVILNAVNDNLFADIHDLEISEIIFLFVNSLVDFFIVLNTVTEILCGSFWIKTNIVGGRGLDFQDIAHDQVLIITL